MLAMVRKLKKKGVVCRSRTSLGWGASYLLESRDGRVLWMVTISPFRWCVEALCPLQTRANYLFAALPGLPRCALSPHQAIKTHYYTEPALPAITCIFLPLRQSPGRGKFRSRESSDRRIHLMYSIPDSLILAHTTIRNTQLAALLVADWSRNCPRLLTRKRAQQHRLDQL